MRVRCGLLRELLSGLLLAWIGAVGGSLRARNLRSRRRRRAGGSIVRSLLRYYRARLEGLVVECGRGSLRIEAAILEAGLEGRAVGAEVEVRGVRGGVVRIVQGGWVKVARGRLGEHGFGLAGLPLIHDRSCAWTR